MTAVFQAFFFLAALLFPAAAAAAEGISGYLDLGYSTIRTKNEDNLGNSSQTDSSAISQRYYLSFNKGLTPYLRLSVNGLVNKVDTESNLNGNKSTAELTTIQPVVDLTLRSPVYTAGIKYSKTEVTSTSSGSPSTTLDNDFYQGILGWKPPDPNLPVIDMRLARTHTYDAERISIDNVSDTAALTMTYTPVDKVLVLYKPTYTDNTNRLVDLETKTLTHSGLVQYSDQFFHNRFSVSTSYNVTYNEMQVSVGGTGSVDISVPPFSGLASLDDTPGDGALAPNAALIDGNTIAGAGINIGLPPLGGDLRMRNFGLDFSFAKEVNTLLVWVDRTLPPAIANSFSWSIYTSSDNVTWGFLTTVFPAPFGTFENRFELNFGSVTTRYIKVVVQPLSPAITGASGFPDIFITELQAFVRKSADRVRGTSRSSSEIINLDGRVLLRENSPNVYYEVTYNQQKTEPGSEERSILSNGLSAAHRFSRIITGTGRVAREDSIDPLGDGLAYVVNASLEAVPLPTLRHSILYSGRFEKKYDGSPSKATNDYFLTNTVQVYTGVTVLASGGLGFTDQADQHQRNTNLNASLMLQPHQTLGLNYSVTSTKAEQWEGNNPGVSTRSTVNAVGTSYHPFETLYLVAGWIQTQDPTTTNRLQSYGLNWSPTLGSSLQFAFTYTESLQTINNAKSRLITPSMQWRVTRTATLTLTYEVVHTTSDLNRGDENTFATDLRAYF